MSVRLHSLRFENPGAPTLVILHGLLGSSRNWATVGKALQDRFDVHALDLRNHGSSPHTDNMLWSELTADVALYLEDHGIGDTILIGHSLGGKIGMKFACDYPERVKKLIIVDIAAKNYPPYHASEFRAMKQIKPGSLESRHEAEALLKPLIPKWGMRQFVMTNLVRDEFGLKWQINLEVLNDSLQILRKNFLEADDRFEGPGLLIVGGKSNFVKDGDVDAMRKWLPNLEERVLANGGHNVHVSDREEFLNILEEWI